MSTFKIIKLTSSYLYSLRTCDHDRTTRVFVCLRILTKLFVWITTTTTDNPPLLSHFCVILPRRVQLLKAPFVKTYNIIKSQTGSNDLDGCEVRVLAKKNNNNCYSSYPLLLRTQLARRTNTHTPSVLFCHLLYCSLVKLLLVFLFCTYLSSVFWIWGMP